MFDRSRGRSLGDGALHYIAMLGSLDGLWCCRFTENRCQHVLPCKIQEEKGHCGNGNRTQQFKVLHGSLLLAWQPILSFHRRGLEVVGDVEDQVDRQDDPRATPQRYRAAEPILCGCSCFSAACPLGASPLALPLWL